MTAEHRYRILHTEASRGWGGQEIRILTEAATFQDAGHAVHLVCPADSDIFAAAPDYGIACTALPIGRKRPAGLAAMRRFLAAWRPDVVNPHSSTDHWLAALARLTLAHRPAIVRTRHISTPVSRGRATRWLYNRGAEFVMTTSQSIVDSLTGDGFLPAGRIAAVPTGIDTDTFRPGDRAAARRAVGLPADAFVFAIVATLRSWKGHAYLIEALARLDHPGAMLVIVGDGPQEAALRELIARHGLAQRVVMTGRQADVVPYLQAADVFALPSYANEGVPQAMLQAMACETPLLGCPTGGIPELTQGLAAATLVPPQDAAALAAAMRAMIAGPAPAEALHALRARVVARYSRAVMYDKALAAFRFAVTASRG